MTKPVTHLHAFVAIHDDGTEGVIAVLAQSGWVPMCFSRPELLDRFIDDAMQVGKDGQIRIERRVFSACPDQSTLIYDPEYHDNPDAVSH